MLVVRGNKNKVKKTRSNNLELKKSYKKKSYRKKAIINWKKYYKTREIRKIIF